MSREKERKVTKYCERGLSLQEVCQTNTCKSRFQSFRIQGHAESGEKKENKQREGKTKIIREYRSRNQNEKAHSQTRISNSGEMTNFVYTIRM